MNFNQSKVVLRSKKEIYLNWSNKLPAFLPAIFDFKKSDTPFSIITVLRREYASVLAAVIGFVFVEIFRTYYITDKWDVSTSSLKILIGTIIIVFVLRSLKHYTKVLTEKDRS